MVYDEYGKGEEREAIGSFVCSMFAVLLLLLLLLGEIGAERGKKKELVRCGKCLLWCKVLR